MKKILHVIDTGGPGGAETVFVELADRLRQRGFESLTVAGRGGWVEQELSRRGLRFQPLDSKGSLNWRFLLGLVDIVRRENVDLIQSHLLGANVYCGLAGAITRKPVVATFHGAVDVSPNERLRWLKLLAMRAGKTKLVTNYIDIPFEVRFNSRPDDPNRSFKVSLGFKVVLAVRVIRLRKSNTVKDGERKKTKDKQNYNLFPIRYGPYFRIGGGNFSFYGYYSLSPLFKSNSFGKEQAGGSVAENFNNFTFGISLAAF